MSSSFYVKDSSMLSSKFFCEIVPLSEDGIQRVKVGSKVRKAATAEYKPRKY